MILVSNVYQSRVDNEAAILLRQDPVVYSAACRDDGMGLSEHQLRNYQKNGFIFLKNFFPEKEAALFFREAGKMVEDHKMKQRREAVLAPGTDSVRSVFGVHRLDDVFARVAADERLVHVASQILGSEVYIHQSRLRLKPGFQGKESYWNSDFETWHVEDGMPRMRAMSCAILLTESNEFNGPLMFIPGSHMHYISCVGKTSYGQDKCSSRKQEYGVPDDTSLRFLIDRAGIQSPKGPAGSVVFFDCNTMYGSNRNVSSCPNSNLFFVYNSVENAVGKPRFGLKPRPEFVASRDDCSPIEPLAPDFSRWR